MSKQLKQVINLSKKTNDRIIVFDNSEPEDSFVLMTLDQYEELLGSNKKSLTEEKIIDKINSNDDRDRKTDNGDKKNNWQIPSQIKEESEE
ncbi:MAG: hypothetical protein WC928_00205 [Patescibacteria group bacterium]|jgi:hypothetical protein